MQNSTDLEGPERGREPARTPPPEPHHGHASSLHCGSQWKGLNFSNEQDPASRASSDGFDNPSDGVTGFRRKVFTGAAVQLSAWIHVTGAGAGTGDAKTMLWAELCPPNPYAEVPAPGTSRRDFLWKQGHWRQNSLGAVTLE